MQPMWEIGIAAGSTALFFAQVAVVRRLRSSLGHGATPLGRVVLVGLAIFFGVFVFASPLGPLGAVAAGLMCNVLVGGRMFQGARRAMRVRRLLERLEGPNAEGALAALEHEVEGLRGGRGGEKPDYEHRARWVLTIASNVARAGHPKRALEWTTRIEAGVLGRPVAAMHAQHEAAFRIATGDREGARRAIARAPRPAIAPWEDALSALEALLEGLDGDAQAAIERATRAIEATPLGLSRATWQMARAHGQAKTGALEDARDTLRSLRSEGGEALLRRVVAHGGPASRVAEAMLAEGGAYR
jgi:hypothetical protein